ncbi:MAG: phosphoadenylyl-sulfate reductase [Deltaproteobacteria bacterium]|nr:phosphoadenylyl-sulfate reductase [Deltaproteobacteria bacterium]
MKLLAPDVATAAARLEGQPAQDVLAWALQTFGNRLAIASSFSIEDCVVIDIAAKIDPQVRVFALDTGRLPEETYQTADRVRDKYRLQIEWYFPARDAVEVMERNKGMFSFMESLDNRHECCGIRKVEPLNRALATVDAWVTGLRREQAVTRSNTPEVEFDEGHGGIAKLNPIIGWSEEQTRAYAKANRVPVHPLHDRGYPSIGCAPCTRAVAPGEHPRAGRWWWENPESKECGLHPVRG